jgi:hypothetical protein
MTSVTRSLAVAAGLALSLAAPLAAHAQNMRPGQWEFTRSVSDPRAAEKLAEMRRKLDAMPAEQRKRYESMLLVGPSSAARPGELSTKTCITPELAKKYDFPTQKREGCSSSVVERGGGKVHVKGTCADQSSWDVVATFSSDTAFDATITTSVEGQPPRTVKSTGRWIQDTCPVDKK